MIETPLPKETYLIDSVSKAGKLVGNGNGMQYFGAILIESELTLSELDMYYSTFRGNEWSYIVEVQEAVGITVLEHGSLSFENLEDVMKDGDYYIVYSWVSGDGFWECFDIRGN